MGGRYFVPQRRVPCSKYRGNMRVLPYVIVCRWQPDEWACCSSVQYVVPDYRFCCSRDSEAVAWSAVG